MFSLVKRHWTNGINTFILSSSRLSCAWSLVLVTLAALEWPDNLRLASVRVPLVTAEKAQKQPSNHTINRNVHITISCHFVVILIHRSYNILLKLITVLPCKQTNEFMSTNIQTYTGNSPIWPLGYLTLLSVRLDLFWSIAKLPMIHNPVKSNKTQVARVYSISHMLQIKQKLQCQQTKSIFLNQCLLHSILLLCQFLAISWRW